MMQEAIAARLRAVTVTDLAQATQALRAAAALARMDLPGTSGTTTAPGERQAGEPMPGRTTSADAGPALSAPPRLLLLSPPAAASWLSPNLFLAILREAARMAAAGAETAHAEPTPAEMAGAAAMGAPPGPAWRGVLDCGASPGHALAALRAGITLLVLEPGCPAFPRIAAAANRIGAAVWPRRPPALDAASLDRRPDHAQAQLVAWLGGADVAR